MVGGEREVVVVSDNEGEPWDGDGKGGREAQGLGMTRASGGGESLLLDRPDLPFERLSMRRGRASRPCNLPFSNPLRRRKTIAKGPQEELRATFTFSRLLPFFGRTAGRQAVREIAGRVCDGGWPSKVDAALQRARISKQAMQQHTILTSLLGSAQFRRSLVRIPEPVFSLVAASEPAKSVTVILLDLSRLHFPIIKISLLWRES